jgi:Protein-disulfide isomerase
MKRSLQIAAVLACTMLVAPAAVNAQSFNDQQKTELQSIIREYLVQHPEVLQEAMAELEKRQVAAEAEKTKAAVKNNAQTLFDSSRQVVVGNAQGDVTLVEFFDYNCGYCKRALTDLTDLMKDDSKLRVVLKEFPVLGPGSQEAAQVAIAARMQDKSGKKYFRFPSAAAERPRAGRSRARAGGGQGGRFRHGEARARHGEPGGEGHDRGEHEARRAARAQRHAELRGRQRRRGRRSGTRGAQGQGESGTLHDRFVLTTATEI